MRRRQCGSVREADGCHVVAHVRGTTTATAPRSTLFITTASNVPACAAPPVIRALTTLERTDVVVDQRQHEEPPRA
jgi:hypothetical protein